MGNGNGVAADLTGGVDDVLLAIEEAGYMRLRAKPESLYDTRRGRTRATGIAIRMRLDALLDRGFDPEYARAMLCYLDVYVEDRASGERVDTKEAVRAELVAVGGMLEAHYRAATEDNESVLHRATDLALVAQRAIRVASRAFMQRLNAKRLARRRARQLLGLPAAGRAG